MMKVASYGMPAYYVVDRSDDHGAAPDCGTKELAVDEYDPVYL